MPPSPYVLQRTYQPGRVYEDQDGGTLLCIECSLCHGDGKEREAQGGLTGYGCGRCLGSGFEWARVWVSPAVLPAAQRYRHHKRADIPVQPETPERSGE